VSIPGPSGPSCFNVVIETPRYIILWKHFISWGRNFVVWRRRTYSWVLDFVDCPTHEIKKIQNYYLQFLTDAKLRPNNETGSIAKLQISEWLCLLSYVTPEDIDPRQQVNVFTVESHQTTFMTPNCQLACHLRDYNILFIKMLRARVPSRV